jgi:hypothetical protein
MAESVRGRVFAFRRFACSSTMAAYNSGGIMTLILIFMSAPIV